MILQCVAGILLLAFGAAFAQSVTVYQLTSYDKSVDAPDFRKMNDTEFTELEAGSQLPSFEANDLVLFQSYFGMGVSFDRSSMNNFLRMSPARREEALRGMFDPGQADGVKLNIIRFPLGTSDFTNTEWYTYDDLPSGQTDPLLEHFSIAPDSVYGFVALLQEVMAINPDIKLIGSPWSPPAWMKSNGSLVKGGNLKSEYIDLYAEYLSRVVEAYAARGVRFYAISPQNEPEYSTDYPSCRMSRETLGQLQSALDRELAERNLDTKIILGDAQWSKKSEYHDPLTAQAQDNGNDRVVGAGWHFYVGGPSAMSDYQNSYPGKLNILTEVQMKVGNRYSEICTYFHNWAHGIIDWVTFLDSEGETINDGNPWKPMGPGKFVYAEHTDPDAWHYVRLYYVYGMITRWVQPGARRIQTPESAHNINTVGFKNPDGSVVMTLFTESSSSTFDGGDYRVIWNAKQAVFSVPDTRSIVTLIWKGRKTIDRSDRLQAESAEEQSGLEPAGPGVGFSDGGDYLLFRDVNLSGYDVCTVRFARASSGNQAISIRTGSPEGEEIGSLDAVSTGGWNCYVDNGALISKQSGTHDLYLYFTGSGSSLGNIDWVQFEKLETPTSQNSAAPPKGLAPARVRRQNQNQNMVWVTPLGEIIRNPHAVKRGCSIYYSCIRNEAGLIELQSRKLNIQ